MSYFSSRFNEYENSGNALYDACCNSDYEELVKLIKSGIDIQEFDSEICVVYNDYHPLTYSSQKGDLEIVKLLIENGAKVKVKDDEPIRFASFNAHLKIVKLLHYNGGDIDKAIENADNSIKSILIDYKISFIEKELMETDIKAIQPEINDQIRKI